MPDIGAQIRLIREDLGLTRAEFGARIGEKPTKIQDIEAGKQRINDIFLLKLLGEYPISLDELFSGAANSAKVVNSSGAKQPMPALITIPKLDVRASAGTGQPAYSEDEVGRYAVKASWLERRGLKPENLRVVTVVGDSMVPDIYEDDRIIVDLSQTALKDTHIYAVRFSGDVFVKRIQRLPDDRALLISKNADYPAMPIDGDMDFKVIGRVVSSMHEW